MDYRYLFCISSDKRRWGEDIPYCIYDTETITEDEIGTTFTDTGEMSRGRKVLKLGNTNFYYIEVSKDELDV